MSKKLSVPQGLGVHRISYFIAQKNGVWSLIQNTHMNNVLYVEIRFTYFYFFNLTLNCINEFDLSVSPHDPCAW